MLCALSRFQHLRPRHEIAQEKLQEWIIEAHVHAAHHFEGKEMKSFRQELRAQVARLRLGPERIQRRGIHIRDFFEEDWAKMEIYALSHQPKGEGFAKRSAFFDREMTQVFQQFYPEGHEIPAHLVHVTCTGYVAPSPAQKLVSLKNWGTTTTVTHAYHMGCYASIPAIRMGIGFASPKTHCDLVHTEVCSLHLHPLRHSVEQLLVQNLFGDGFIKYSLSAKEPKIPHLKVLALLEETIPNSAHCMTWQCEDHGLGMTLSKEVPFMIAKSITGYLERLCQKVRMKGEHVLSQALFAIHPGGPKIVEQIKKLLVLRESQVAHSVDILKSYGNMSSATLPHIWEAILNDSNVEKGTLILSLAFGPGLSIAGGLFEKG